jgi:hypothetical protein
MPVSPLVASGRSRLIAHRKWSIPLRRESATATPADPWPVPAELFARLRKSVRWYGLAAGTLVLAALAIAVSMLFRLTRPTRPELAYTQITNFTDSAIGPALSPDGRMVAFYRSSSWWFTTGPIYVKMLPNTPVNASMAASRLATHDSGPGWFASPFLDDSFIHNSTSVYPGALRILLGLPARLTSIMHFLP